MKVDLNPNQNSTLDPESQATLNFFQAEGMQVEACVSKVYNNRNDIVSFVKL